MKDRPPMRVHAYFRATIQGGARAELEPLYYSDGGPDPIREEGSPWLWRPDTFVVVRPSAELHIAELRLGRDAQRVAQMFKPLTCFADTPTIQCDAVQIGMPIRLTVVSDKMAPAEFIARLIGSAGEPTRRTGGVRTALEEMMDSDNAAAAALLDDHAREARPKGECP